MHKTVVLTVSESKRLIAKGIANHPLVVRAMEEGMVAVAPGTTNGYVVEELLGESMDKTQFVTGHTVPAGFEGARPSYAAADLVLKKGERLDLSAVEAADEMGPGDIFIKGANAVNYEDNQAGILIGHPTGGTLGAVLGRLIARRCDLLHPVGLEKQIPGDLHELAMLLRDPEGEGPTLWVTPGELFTEIEAIQAMAAVEAFPISAGGIGGAEGSIWLALFGDAEDLDRAMEIVASVQGEPPFLG